MRNDFAMAGQLILSYLSWSERPRRYSCFGRVGAPERQKKVGAEEVYKMNMNKWKCEKESQEKQNIWNIVQQNLESDCSFWWIVSFFIFGYFMVVQTPRWWRVLDHGEIYAGWSMGQARWPSMLKFWMGGTPDDMSILSDWWFVFFFLFGMIVIWNIETPTSNQMLDQKRRPMVRKCYPRHDISRDHQHVSFFPASLIGKKIITKQDLFWWFLICCVLKDLLARLRDRFITHRKAAAGPNLDAEEYVVLSWRCRAVRYNGLTMQIWYIQHVCNKCFYCSFSNGNDPKVVRTSSKCHLTWPLRMADFRLRNGEPRWGLRFFSFFQ